MCRDSCAKCSFRLLVIFNVLVLIGSLGLIIGLGVLIGDVTSFSNLLPRWMMWIALVGAVFLFIASLLGCVSASCTYKQINDKIESSGYDYDGEEGGGGSGHTIMTIMFLTYLFLVGLFCLLCFGGGLFGAAYSAQLTGSAADPYIQQAQNGSKIFANVAMGELDVVVYNYMTINPTWWYDAQEVMGCCGYRNFNNTIGQIPAVVQGSYNTDQNACYTDSKRVAELTNRDKNDAAQTNAAECQPCKNAGTSAAACSSSTTFADCPRLESGCPLYTGPKCYDVGTAATGCYEKITDYTKSNAIWISVGMILFAILLLVVEFSGLSLCCIKCCCAHRS